MPSALRATCINAIKLNGDTSKLMRRMLRETHWRVKSARLRWLCGRRGLKTQEKSVACVEAHSDFRCSTETRIANTAHYHYCIFRSWCSISPIISLQTNGSALHCALDKRN